MYQSQLLAILALTGPLVQATPVLGSSGFSAECSNITLDAAFWLVGTCPDKSGNPVTSSVYLPSWIENHEANLTWQNGGNFESSCQNCALINGGGSLECFCEGTYANGNSTLNLEKHIANYNGHLLCDLDGTPTVPSNSSSVPVPSDVTLTVAFSTSSESCGSTFSWNFYAHQACWAFTFANGRPTSFYSAQITTNPGWSVEAYNVSDCSGSPLGSFGLHDVNKCQAFEGGASFFKVVPLWNWD